MCLKLVRNEKICNEANTPQSPTFIGYSIISICIGIIIYIASYPKVKNMDIDLNKPRDIDVRNILLTTFSV